MKVLLVAALHHPHSMNFAHCMDIVGAKYSHMPLALPTLAALTPPDVAVELVDENCRPVPFDTDADVVGISGSVPQRKRVFELAAEFRRRGKLVILGGPITFDLLEPCRENADVVFVGEAESTWPRFIADLKAGAPKALYDQSEWIEPSASPLPRYELLEAGDYASACIQVTRGCPQRCTFCDIPVKYGNQPRSKPIPRVLEEIRVLSRLGYDAVFIVDDNFIGNARYAKQLLRQIAKLLPELPTQMYFYTQATLNAANDEELLDCMQAARMRRLFIGIETGDQAALRRLNKVHQVGMDIAQACEKFRAHGITVWAGMIFGLEGDTPETFQKQYEFIRDTNFFPLQIGLLQAIPQTPLYVAAAAEDRVTPLPSLLGLTALSEEELSKGTNLRHKTLGERELELEFAAVLRRLHTPEFYRAKMLRFIESGSRGTRASLPAINLRLLGILARTLKYYLWTADAATRRMFSDVIAALVKKRLRGLDEAVFHLIIYKHLRMHYNRIATLCESRR